jgi:BirA family biotin operon repressor/biotin-[acetyl-CoA-carboxylase] ligase
VPDVATAALDGVSATALANELSLPAVHIYEQVGSTMDVASALGDLGTPAGTLVVADTQITGRGRSGRRWSSAPGAGLWMTLIERPNDPSALPVLPLRIGLRMARVLERWTSGSIQLKWPNDLYVGGRKLAGVLIEARWREQRLDWVAIGVGINLAQPEDMPDATHLTNAPRRLVLAELIPAIRAAASARGTLSAQELDAYRARDFARGKRCLTPADGVVEGIAESGELLIRTTSGTERYLSGSLELDLRPQTSDP